MNPWHDVEPGKRAPEIVDCIIEVPRGSRNKYELDKKTGLLRLDRVLYSAVFYPANYGFIPRTYCDDRDPLDILVLGQEPVVPMCIVTARPIGMMQMVDQNEEDDKIIAIHENDPAVSHYRDISQLPEHTLNELQRFFEDYKILEHKRVRIERFFGRVDAQNVIAKSLRLYNDSYDDLGRKRADAPLLQSELRDRNSSASAPSRAVRFEHARRHAERLQNLDTHPEGEGKIGETNGVNAVHAPVAPLSPLASPDSRPLTPAPTTDDSAATAASQADASDSNQPPEALDSAARSVIEPITFDLHTLDAHAPRGQSNQSTLAQDNDSANAATPSTLSDAATPEKIAAPELAGDTPINQVTDGQGSSTA
jgi:inorganic pyrophosphatase